MTGKATQQGMALAVVMMALLLMAFATVALLRSTDTATLALGNLSFQRAALGQADGALQMAEQWLADNNTGGALFSNNSASGYFATRSDGCDFTGNTTPNTTADDVRWPGVTGGSLCLLQALAVTPTGLAAGYGVSYVITRLCNAQGDPASPLAADGVTPMTCANANTATLEGSTRAAASYGQTPLSGGNQYYYRITVRVVAPRGGTRYVQTLVIL